jgi:hypothetical protein
VTHWSCQTVYGVDFSGARLAGRSIWLAEATPHGDRLHLNGLERLDRITGTADRAPCLAALRDRILQSDNALWGIDAPFGLPIELFPEGTDWPGMLDAVASHPEAPALGHWCVAQAHRLGHRPYIGRAADLDAHAPLHCYHYRIIYQTFHAMRDLCRPLAAAATTAVLPFQYDRLPTARRVVVETCPAVTLTRMGLPHQRYKRPTPGPVGRSRARVRAPILAGLDAAIRIAPRDRRRIARDPGGDALDAVIAAVGVARAWHRTDHAATARDARAVREGFLYA